MFLESIFDDCPEASDTVLPADFFAFRETPRYVANGDFPDLVAVPQQLGSDFCFELKAAARKRNGFENGCPEKFVAGVSVSEAAAVQKIIDESQHSDPPDESRIALTIGMDVARPVDSCMVRVAIELSEQGGKFVWRILKVGILNDHGVAGSVFDSGPDCGTFAAVFRVLDVFDFREVRPQRFLGPVSGAIVDDDDFLIPWLGQILRHDFFYDRADSPFFVEGRDDDGKCFDHLFVLDSIIPEFTLSRPTKIIEYSSR